MRRYCLYCFATLPAKERYCAHCGGRTHPSDYRLFWNKNRDIRRVERGIKVLTVVATIVAVYLFIFWVGPTSMGVGGGFFFLLPLIAAHGIWKSASSLTRVQPYFQVGVFWGAVFALLGIILATFHWFLLTIPAVLILGVCFAVRDFRRWKRRLCNGVPAA